MQSWLKRRGSKSNHKRHKPSINYQNTKTTMKRFIFGMVAAVLLTMMAGVMSACKGCHRQGGEVPVPSEQPTPEQEYHDYDGVVQDFTAGVSQVQALHKQTMFSTLGVKDYQWRNSRVIFNDTVTLENIDEVKVVAVNDVFFYWNERGPWVQYINSHVVNGTQIPWPINDVWIEDASLSDQPIKLSAEQALARLKEWNGVLPKSHFLTLRLPVGPKDCNVQWVFGDEYDVVFVDAVTGEVRDWDPAFPRK